MVRQCMVISSTTRTYKEDNRWLLNYWATASRGYCSNQMIVINPLGNSNSRLTVHLLLVIHMKMKFYSLQYRYTWPFMVITLWSIKQFPVTLCGWVNSSDLNAKYMYRSEMPFHHCSLFCTQSSVTLWFNMVHYGDYHHEIYMWSPTTHHHKRHLPYSIMCIFRNKSMKSPRFIR